MSFSRAAESLFEGDRLESGEFIVLITTLLCDRQWPISKRPVSVVALLTNGKSNGEPVAGWGKRTGGEGRVGAGRIFQVIEIEDKLAGFIEAIGRQAGIEEAAGSVGGRGACRVAENKEKLGDGGIFQDGLEAKGLSPKNEFGSARDGLIVARANESGQRDGFWRRVGNPLGSDTIGGVRWIQLESMESNDAGRMRILDTKSKTGLTADDIEIQSTDREVRRNFVVVGFGAERLLFCGCARHKEVRWESVGGRI